MNIDELKQIEDALLSLRHVRSADIVRLFDYVKALREFQYRATESPDGKKSEPVGTCDPSVHGQLINMAQRLMERVAELERAAKEQASQARRIDALEKAEDLHDVNRRIEHINRKLAEMGRSLSVLVDASIPRRHFII